jgi:hypothetical protein
VETINVALPAEIAVQLPAAAGGASVTILTEDLPGHILATLVSFGIKQKLDHKVAGNIKAGVTEADSRKECESVIDQLTGGTWAKRGGGARVVTFEQFAQKRATATAEQLVKPGKEYAGKDQGKVAEALLRNEPWLAKQRKAWDSIQAGKEAKNTSGLVLDL